jgi:uncharacterized protein YgbK (DUF1537 family)
MLLSFLGDDFTGSTDCLEALAKAGVTARLYLVPPETPPTDCQVVGIAGTSRTMTPAEMDAALPPLFAALKALGAPICHYKICSTFDSSASVGSIGRALELGRGIFDDPRATPVLVGAPPLGRYVAFGNLFARDSGDPGAAVSRLDRHPTMPHHPVTPMDEADLRRHLARQTDLPIAHADLRAIESGRAVEALQSGGIALFDTTSDAHLATLGALLWAEKPALVVGSSGVEYALVAAWRAADLLPTTPPSFVAEPVDRLVVASGSASPVTDHQLARAEREGFVVLPLERADEGIRALADGKSVAIATARGPRSVTPGAGGRALGENLAGALRRLLTASGVRRAVVCGGDTSGFVGQSLGITALEFVAPMAPGSPLCRVIGGDWDGLEVVFKGGQVGTDDLLGRIRDGR